MNEEKNEVKILAEIQGKLWRLTPYDGFLVLTGSEEKKSSMKTNNNGGKKNTVKKPSTRIPSEQVWKRSRKYGATVSLDEKDKTLNEIIRKPGISSNEIVNLTGMRYEKVLAVLDLLKEDNMITKKIDGLQQGYVLNP